MHWHNSPRKDMSLHMDTLSRFQDNQSLLFLLSTYRLIHGLFHIALDIGPEGRYQSRADDKDNMKKAMY